MPNVLDLEQALLLLEITPPFDKRAVQIARRRMAKVWHPDIAPPGKQFEHERHLKAINEAADQLERLAEGSRGGTVSRNAVKVSAAAARAARAEEGRRAGSPSTVVSSSSSTPTRPGAPAGLKQWRRTWSCTSAGVRLRVGAGISYRCPKEAATHVWLRTGDNHRCRLIMVRTFLARGAKGDAGTV